MRNRNDITASSMHTDAILGYVPPGPLDGLIRVLPAVVPQVKGDDGHKRPNLDPLGTLVEDSRELAELVWEMRARLELICGPGASGGPTFTPSLAERRKSAGEARDLAKAALTLTSEIRPLLVALAPVLTAASALVELQTPGISDKPTVLDAPDAPF
jgi:hypothetical protein